MEDGGAETHGDMKPDLKRVLEDLLSLSGEVDAGYVVSSEGRLLASITENGAGEERVGTTISTLSGLSNRRARELRRVTCCLPHYLTAPRSPRPPGRKPGWGWCSTICGMPDRRPSGCFRKTPEGVALSKLRRGAVLLGVAAGAAYAVKSYLRRSHETGGGEVQLSFEDGTSQTLVSEEAEEFTDIARSILGAGGR